MSFYYFGLYLSFFDVMRPADVQRLVKHGIHIKTKIDY